MAIICSDPISVGKQAENLFDVTITEGKSLIKLLNDTITGLKDAWKGSDATKNINDLIMVHDDVVRLIKGLQEGLVIVNNQHIIGMQKNIVSSGGSCTIAKELVASTDLKTIDDKVPESNEVYATEAIIDLADNFSDISNKFITFVDVLNTRKDSLTRNWTDGAGIGDLKNLFNQFDKVKDSHLFNLSNVSKNMDAVAAGKKAILND